MYRISQVTCTLDLTRPSPACRISSRAPVWKIWSVVAVAAYKVSRVPPPAKWAAIWKAR